MNKMMLYKESKLIFERKKIFIYILLGLLFPSAMEYVFLTFKPIIPLELAMDALMLFVAMLGSEFLYISFIDEIMYNGLDILLISPTSKSKIIFFKNFFPFLLTILVTVSSILIHDCLKISSCVLFNGENILFLMVAATLSIFGEWLCLLVLDEYNANNHSLFMIISYAIAIFLFYLQHAFSFVFYAFCVFIILIIYYLIILKLLRLKESNKINKRYFSCLYSSKRMHFMTIECLRIVCELRRIDHVLIKSMILFFLPILSMLGIHFQVIPSSGLLLWLLVYLYLSSYMNMIVFPAYMNDVLNKIDIIRFVAGKRPYHFFYVSILLLGLITISIPLMQLSLGSILLKLTIPQTFYMLTLFSFSVHFVLFIIFSRWLKDMKDYKAIYFVYSLVSIVIHYAMFFVM